MLWFTPSSRTSSSPDELQDFWALFSHCRTKATVNILALCIIKGLDGHGWVGCCCSAQIAQLSDCVSCQVFLTLDGVSPGMSQLLTRVSPSALAEGFVTTVKGTQRFAQVRHACSTVQETHAELPLLLAPFHVHLQRVSCCVLVC